MVGTIDRSAVHSKLACAAGHCRPHRHPGGLGLVGGRTGSAAQAGYPHPYRFCDDHPTYPGPADTTDCRFDPNGDIEPNRHCSSPDADTHHSSRTNPHPNFYLPTDAHANHHYRTRDIYPDLDAPTDAHSNFPTTDANPNLWILPHIYSNLCAYANVHTDSHFDPQNTHSYPNRHADSDTYPNGYTHTYPNIYANRHTDTYANIYANRHTDGYLYPDPHPYLSSGDCANGAGETVCPGVQLGQ